MPRVFRFAALAALPFLIGAAPSPDADFRSLLAQSMCGYGTPGQADPRNQTQVRQLGDIRRGLERYVDFRVAQREGWTAFGGDEPLMGQHFVPPRGTLDYVHGQELDFSRPNVLMYTKMNGRMVLVGAAFIVRIAPGDPLPAGLSGDGDRWHVHNLEEAFAAMTETRPFLRGLGSWWLTEEKKRAGGDQTRLSMLHTWVLEPNPDGMFADFNRTLPYRELGIPLEYSRMGSLSAGRGLHLATDAGCAETVDPDFWMADANGRQQRTIRRACHEARDEVRAALRRRADATELNAVAELAWNRFEDAMNTTLDATQQRRLASIVENGGHGNHRTQVPPT
jgi:hypothetical protein